MTRFVKKLLCVLLANDLVAFGQRRPPPPSGNQSVTRPSFPKPRPRPDTPDRDQIEEMLGELKSPKDRKNARDNVESAIKDCLDAACGTSCTRTDQASCMASVAGPPGPGGKGSKKDRRGRKDAGKKQAMNIYRECLADPTKDLRWCKTEMGDALKGVLGRGVSKTKLKEIVREEVNDVAANGWESCRDKATKVACLRDVTEQMATLRGRDSSDIKLNEVHKAALQASESRSFEAVSNCTGMHGKERSQCLDEARAKRAQALGKNTSQVNDRMLVKEARKGVVRFLRGQIIECMEAVEFEESNETVEDCMDEAVVELVGNGFASKNMTMADFADVLTRCGEQEAEEFDCDDEGNGTGNESCSSELRRRLAYLEFSNDSDTVREIVMRRLLGKGAVDGARRSIESCSAAFKQLGWDFECEDPQEFFRRGRRQGNSTDGRIEERSMKMELVARSQEILIRECMSADNETELHACLEDLAADAEEEFDEAFGDEFSDMGDPTRDVRRARRRALMLRKGLQRALGQAYLNCLTGTNGTEEDMMICQYMVDEVSLAMGPGRRLQGGIGIEKIGDLLKRDRAERCATSVENCEDPRSCRMEAVEEFGENEGSHYRFADRQMLGAIRAAAETGAACLESLLDTNEDLEQCGDHAHERFAAIIGVNNGTLWDEVADKVKDLAGAIADDNETFIHMRDAIKVRLLDNESFCSMETSQDFLGLVQGVLQHLNASEFEVEAKGCVLIDDLAHYRFAIPVANLAEDEVGKFSDAVALTFESLESEDGDGSDDVALVGDVRRLQSRDSTDPSGVFSSPATEETTSPTRPTNDGNDRYCSKTVRISEAKAMEWKAIICEGSMP